MLDIVRQYLSDKEFLVSVDQLLDLYHGAYTRCEVAGGVQVAAWPNLLISAGREVEGQGWECFTATAESVGFRVPMKMGRG